jgi:hypothetical protein
MLKNLDPLLQHPHETLATSLWDIWNTWDIRLQHAPQTLPRAPRAPPTHMAEKRGAPLAVESSPSRRPSWVGRPSGSPEPIWALLGLAFGLWALVGFRIAGPGASLSRRSESLGKRRVGLWAYNCLYPNSTLLKPLYILSAKKWGSYLDSYLDEECYGPSMPTSSVFLIHLHG